MNSKHIGLINSNSQKPINQPSVGQMSSGGGNYYSQEPNESQYFNHNNGLSPEKLIKKFEREYNDIYSLSLEEINRELDNNMNETIILLNRRKALINQKRKKLKQDFYNKEQQLKRMNPEELHQELVRGSHDDKTLQGIIMNTQNIGRMQKIVNSVTRDLNTNTEQKQKMEMSKSGDFWNGNKSYEQEIDNLLKQLKFYDGQLEDANREIHDSCRVLDQIEDTIKDLLTKKHQDHVQRAEPLFNDKQQKLSFLGTLTGQRNKVKDEKINLIHRIIDQLSNLQNLRDRRLSELSGVFGIDENAESNVKISYYIDFVDQLENLAKIKENVYELEQQEEPIDNELDRLFRENDGIFQELIRRQSEEARIFSDAVENQKQRLQFQRVIEYFITHANLDQLQHLDIKDILQKFKDNIIFLKPLVEEDVAIRRGLQKTQETITTFENILHANKLEKQRRHQLIASLENCYKLKSQTENQSQRIKSLEVELSRKVQEKNHLEQEIENCIGDGELDEYKRLDQILKQQEQQTQRMHQEKDELQKQMDQINLEVINQMGMIKQEYEDIIKEVAPQNLMNTYDFSKANDIKHVQNYLKKTFKRLGLNFDDSSMQSKSSSQFISNSQNM